MGEGEGIYMRIQRILSKVTRASTFILLYHVLFFVNLNSTNQWLDKYFYI